jgi:hypothetical protein
MTETRIDGFRVLEELGSGALFSVYKATQEPLGRTVALKMLKPTIAPGSAFAAQIEREARVLAELCHPNVSLLYDFVKTEAGMYLVLEYVDGFSLSTVLAKLGAGAGLPPDVAAAIGVEVARGLAHAHERGIVHRDVKPANVLLSKRGEVKIADFGIAQRESLPSLDEPLASLPNPRLEDSAFGTPAYMSPEQILGEVVDSRSDVFSLGVVLYQLVCGARPFEKGDESDRRAAAQRIRRDPAIPLHRRAPDVPRGLERIIMRSLEKLPMDRYSSAAALADHLEEFLEARGQPPRRRLAVRALVQTGLVPLDTDAGALVEAPREIRASTRPTILGLAAIALLAVGGGIAIQASGWSHREGLQAGDRPLELVPAASGGLRVLATPWAEVWVDGQIVETTPFARAVPLAAGPHYVRLRHPNAPDEKRVINVTPGETVTLDVAMDIGAVPHGAAPAPSAATSTSDANNPRGSSP